MGKLRWNCREMIPGHKAIASLFWVAAWWVNPSLFGQITITSADMPGSGDTLRFSTALTAPAALYTLAGPNQTWDFSGLSPASQDLASYRSSLQTPYAFFFLGLNKYGRKVADSLGAGAFQFTDVYNFFRKTSQAFEIEGIGLRYQGLPLPAYYSVRDKLYQFPLQYSDRDSSNFRFSISLSTLASYSQVGYRINEAEGWGTITTPFGTFNCLKVKSTVVSDDSLNISGFPLRFTRRTLEYKWLANGHHIPILEITGNLLGNTFLPTQIRYRDIPRSNVLLDPPQAQFSASPLVTQTGMPVAFSNLSTGAFLGFQWEFDPADGLEYQLGTDTSRNPVVTFSQPGTYTVRLRATNFIGSDEEVKTGYIQILDPTSAKTSEQARARICLPGNRPVPILTSSGQTGPPFLTHPLGRVYPLRRQGEDWVPAGFVPEGWYWLKIPGEPNRVQVKLIQHSQP